MNESKRTQNANKLFNRVLECENDLKTLYNFGFKLVNLNSTGLDQYFATRSKLRCTLERLIVEEEPFAFANSFHLKLWEEVYEKPIGWIQDHLQKSLEKTTYNTLHLKKLQSLLCSFMDEGSSLFQLLLRPPSTPFKYHFSVYAAILLRKREILSGSAHSRSFALLQDAIVCEPQNGYGYFILAQWTRTENDTLLAMYWALIAANTSNPYNSLEFLKDLSRTVAISPSFAKDFKNDLSQELLQMAAHALLSLLTGRSHLKHLDQLSHSQIKECSDIKSLKYACVILWMILRLTGLNRGFDGNNIHDSNNTDNQSSQVTQTQSCLLAKLFQVHAEFLHKPAIKGIFLAFASNPFYSELFTQNNYKSLEKINNLAYDRLNDLLKKLLETESVIDDRLYLDYVFLKAFENSSLKRPSSIVDYFLEQGLYIETDSGLLPTNLWEKSRKTERSMKLLTHRFLAAQLESLEATLEQDHLPWTIPDFPCLLRHFSKIRRSILSREMRVVITAAVLQELDSDKLKNGKSREIIRFLHERLELHDPSIKISETSAEELYATDNDCRIVALDPETFKALVDEKRIPLTNLFNEL